jgi:ketosteroid isomerase-like protein
MARTKRAVVAFTVPTMSDTEILAAFDAFFDRLTVDRDAAAATALFADDDDIWMSGSDLPELAIGTDAIAALHRDVVARPFTLTFSWDRRHVHSEGQVAWVNAAGSLLVEYEDKPPTTMQYRITVVLVRRDGAWRWHTMNGSEPHIA